MRPGQGTPRSGYRTLPPFFAILAFRASRNARGRHVLYEEAKKSILRAIFRLTCVRKSDN
jgi:hypothetical protein